ncbi:MAG: DUF11 domain-containing protein, partial [Verrucomicrobiota bacterium]|nr:DUF11 domain-containing protein [Verrucomicrobiota bacterium]
TNGAPIVSSRRLFVTGLSGAEGAVIDPLTSDFLFSTYGGGNRIVRVQGFGVPLPADVEVTAFAPSNSFPCRSISYRISVVNRGPARATGIFVSDTLPANAALLSVQVSRGSFSIVTNDISWTVGFLPLNATATMDLVVAIESAGIVSNYVSVAANEGDLVTSNNVATTTTVIEPIPPRMLLIDRGLRNIINICWGSDNTGFNLEFTTNLTFPISWQPVTSNITDNGSVRSLRVTNTFNPSAVFYRLHNPSGIP